MAIDFSGLSPRRLPGKILRAPLRLIPRSAVVPIIQGPLRGKRWIVGAGNQGYWLGSYELPKQQLFVQTVQPGWTVLDVGAHTGYYTLLTSTLVGDKGRVVSCEPSPRNLAYLRRHMSLNSCDNVEIRDVAVSGACGTAIFDNMRSSFTGRLFASGVQNGVGVTVQTVTLDSLLDEDIRPNLIKMDIEGAEGDALDSGLRLLAECRPALFLATHGPAIHRHCCDLLRDLGYELTALTGKHGETTLETTDEILARHPDQARSENEREDPAA